MNPDAMRSRRDLSAGCGIPAAATGHLLRFPGIGISAIAAILAGACTPPTPERSSAAAPVEVIGVVAAVRPPPPANPALIAITAAVGRQTGSRQPRAASPAAARANEVIIVLDGDGGTISLVLPAAASVAVGERVRVDLGTPARLLGPAS
jgi:hypothetical protein